MTTKIKSMALMLAATCLMTACLNDEKAEVTLYGDAAITGVTLGTMNRYVYYKRSTTGVKDSLVKTTYTGSNYKMYIDQTNGTIYNENPLPAGTDAAHVLLTIATKNSSVVTLKSLTSDSVRLVSATDSIDLSQPRTFRVFSSDGTYSRDYKLQLMLDNLSATDSAFFWTQEAQWPDSVVAQQDTLTTSWPYANVANAIYQLQLIKTAAADSMLWRKITATVGGGSWTLIPQEPENLHRLKAADVVALVTAVEPGVLPLRYVAVALMADGTTRVSRDEGITWKPWQGFDLPDNCGQLLRAAQTSDGTVWIENLSHSVWRSVDKTAGH